MVVNFADAGMSEILARVCYRLIEQEWRRRGSPKDGTGPITIGMLQERLGQGTFPWVDTHLLAAAVAIQSGTPLRVWRDTVCSRSRAGYDWRRCLLREYKANRRSDPRITNRGVMRQLSIEEIGNE